MARVRVRLNPKKCEACRVARQHVKVKLKSFLSSPLPGTKTEPQRVCMFHYRYFGIRKMIRQGNEPILKLDKTGNFLRIEYGAEGPKYPITMTFEVRERHDTGIVYLKHGVSGRLYSFDIPLIDVVEVLSPHIDKISRMMANLVPTETKDATDTVVEKMSKFLDMPAITTKKKSTCKDVSPLEK